MEMVNGRTHTLIVKEETFGCPHTRPLLLLCPVRTISHLGNTFLHLTQMLMGVVVLDLPFVSAAGKIGI